MIDYLIIGGGSAGCVLAARLSEEAASTVCLVEAGRNISAVDPMRNTNVPTIMIAERIADLLRGKPPLQLP